MTEKFGEPRCCAQCPPTGSVLDDIIISLLSVHLTWICNGIGVSTDMREAYYRYVGWSLYSYDDCLDPRFNTESVPICCVFLFVVFSYLLCFPICCVFLFVVFSYLLCFVFVVFAICCVFLHNCCLFLHNGCVFLHNCCIFLLIIFPLYLLGMGRLQILVTGKTVA